MTEYKRELRFGQFTIHEVQVCPAYATGQHLQEKLPAAGFRRLQLR
jgi:hypothetical protein